MGKLLHVSFWNNLIEKIADEALDESTKYLIKVDSKHARGWVEMKISVWGESSTGKACAELFPLHQNDVVCVACTSKVTSAIIEVAIHRPVHILSFEPDQFQQALDVVNRLKETKEQLVIVNQSHFGIGKTDELEQLISDHFDSAIAYYAENTSEGSIMEQYGQSDSILFGCNKKWAQENIRQLFSPFLKPGGEILFLDNSEAEFVKHGIVGMLSLRIAYINELANLAESLGLDINTLKRHIGSDHRVGTQYLDPGCGFGGRAFTGTLEVFSEFLKKSQRSQLLNTVLDENELQQEKPFRWLWEYYRCDIHSLKIAIWGASFKAGTSSIINSPCVLVASAIAAQQAKVEIYDPAAGEKIESFFKDSDEITVSNDQYSVLEDADALIVLTNWPQFYGFDRERLIKNMKTPLIIDGRNMYTRSNIENSGIQYLGYSKN